MMTPPLSICAKPRLTVTVPVDVSCMSLSYQADPMVTLGTLPRIRAWRRGWGLVPDRDVRIRSPFWNRALGWPRRRRRQSLRWDPRVRKPRIRDGGEGLRAPPVRAAIGLGRCARRQRRHDDGRVRKPRIRCLHENAVAHPLAEQNG